MKTKITKNLRTRMLCAALACSSAIALIVPAQSAIAAVTSADVEHTNKKDFTLDKFYRENGDLVISNGKNITLKNIKLKGTGQLVIANCDTVTISHSQIEASILIINTKNINIEDSVVSNSPIEIVNQYRKESTSGIIDLSNIAKTVQKTSYVARTVRQNGADDFSKLELKGIDNTNGPVVGKYIADLKAEDNMFALGDSAVTLFFAKDYHQDVQKVNYQVDNSSYTLVKDLGKYRGVYSVYKLGNAQVDIDPKLVGLGDMTILVQGEKQIVLEDIIQNKFYKQKLYLCDENKNPIKNITVKAGQTHKVRVKFEIPTDFNNDSTTATTVAYSEPFTITTRETSDGDRAQIQQILNDPVVMNGKSKAAVYQYYAPAGHVLDEIIVEKKNLGVYLIGNNAFGIYFNDPDKEVFTTKVSLVFVKTSTGKKHSVDANFTIKFTASQQTIINSYKAPVVLKIGDEGKPGFELNKNQNDKFISATTDTQGVTVDENGLIKSSIAFEGKVNATFTYQSAQKGTQYTVVSPVTIVCN